MKKQKIKKANKIYLFFDEDFCDDSKIGYYYCPYNCDPGCLDFEEELLTHFRNEDKIKRKENCW